MTFIPTPECVEVVLHAEQNTIPIVNVFHVNVGATPTVTIMDDLLTLFGNWIADHWLPILHDSYVLTDVTATDISVANGAQRVLSFTSGNQGAVATAPAAANAAICVSWRTGLTGRSFRGRTYIGALPNAYLVDAQTLNGTTGAGLVTVMQALLDALTGAGQFLGVLSKVASGVARVTGVLTEIVTIIIDFKIDSQRRRTAN